MAFNDVLWLGRWPYFDGPRYKASYYNIPDCVPYFVHEPGATNPNSPFHTGWASWRYYRDMLPRCIPPVYADCLWTLTAKGLVWC